MSSRRILIRHSGYWDRSDYIGGDEVIVYMHVSQLSYDNLVQEICEQMDGNGTSDYLIYYTTSMSSGKKVKVSLKNDTDLLRLLVEQSDFPTIYVIKKDKQPTAGATCQSNPVDQRQVPLDEDGEASSSDEEDNHRKDLITRLAHDFEAWIRRPGYLDRITGQGNCSSEQHQGSRTDQYDDVEVRNWMIAIPQVESALPLGWDPPYLREEGNLFVNAVFHSKDELSIAVGMYHMENRVEYKPDQSTKSRLSYVCKHSKECSFHLSAVRDAQVWRIIKFTPDHICQSDLSRTAPRMVPARVVGSYFARRLCTEGIVLKPIEMVAEMRRLYGIEINYKFALRARNIAIELAYGGPEKSYQRLPSYLYVVRERNPGTIYHIQTTQDDEFRYMFLALGQCINAFRQRFLRPVIIVDGTHLKGMNKGILFVATAMDGNEEIFPLAVGLGPIENDESWIYFLSMLRTSLGDPPADLLTVSDQHKSIKNAVEAVYPNVAHGLCFFHLRKNLAHHKVPAMTQFSYAAYCYKHESFEKYFHALRDLNPNGAYKKLCELGIEKWAKSKCPVRRYSVMTSNPCEVMNNRLRWARRLPVCAMIEFYRSVVGKWFDEARAQASSRNHELTVEAFKKLAVSVELGRKYTVRGTTTHVFKVEANNKTTLVDLVHQTCECREFDLDGIPCRHACAVIRHVNNNVYDFVAAYYKTRTSLLTYGPIIHPVPEPREWHVPPSVSSFIVRPPVIVKQAGRPREHRIRSAGESSSTARRTICSRCKGEGHSRRVCIAEINYEEPVIRKRHEKKKCSMCRSADHTKNKCPLYIPNEVSE